MFKFFICLLAGLGAGVGTGIAGMSASAVITPMLVTFLHMDAYSAIGIALASDVLASAVSAYTYGKNKKIDIKNSYIMLITVLIFTLLFSWISGFVPHSTLGGMSVLGTLMVGVKFLIKPVMSEKTSLSKDSTQKKVLLSIVCGAVIGSICGFMGAGGGMMMLLLLTSALGYELKTAVGTSVFIMTFTALVGAGGHFALGGAPDFFCLAVCMLSTLLFARISALLANKASAKTLNRVVGGVMVAFGGIMLLFQFL